MRHPLFVLGGLLVLLVLVGVVIGAWRITTQTTPQEQTDTQGEYATFENPHNVFASLKREEEVAPTVLTTNRKVSQAHTQALNDIIRSWEARPGSTDARTTRTRAQAQIQKPQDVQNSEEISDIFNNLIGPRVTDSGSLQPGVSSQNTSDTALVWTGGYNGATTPTQHGVSTTPTQDALKTYTNQLAHELEVFRRAQGDQAGLLEDFLATRDTKELKRLTDAYVALSDTIKSITPPPPAQRIHNGMIISYKAVGELLWEVSTAHNDEALIERMLTYNAVAEDVARHHISLVTLLRAYGVVFASHEPGSIFTFTPTAVGSGL